MVTITESTREEVEKVLSNLTWVASFWNEKMVLISHEGKMDRDKFLELKASGLKFIEDFVFPVAEDYEKKFLAFPAPKPKEKDVEVNSGNSSEDVKDGPLADGFLDEVSGKKRGRPPGSKNKDKEGTVLMTPVEEPIPVPASLALDTPVPEVLYTPAMATAVPPAPPVTFRTPHTKNRKSFKSGGLSMEQRTQITNRWVDNRGVMTDLKCSELAKEMGFGGPNQVQGWVSYLTKVCNNNPDYAGRAKGWASMIARGMIADIPVPGFFMGTVEVAFTSRTKAVV